MDARGQVVCTYRQSILAELQSSLTGLTKEPAKSFDAPKIVHDERLAKYPAELLQYRKKLNDQHAREIQDFALQHAAWLTTELYADNSTDIPQPALDLICQTVEVARAMYAYWKKFYQTESQWRCYQSEFARHTFNQFWYSLKWSEVYKGSELPTPPKQSLVAKEMERFIAENPRIFEKNTCPKIFNSTASALNLFHDLELSFVTVIRKYLHFVLSNWEEAQEKFKHIPLNLSLLATFSDELEGLKGYAARYIMARIDEQIAEGDAAKKYGIFQIVPTSEHNWLERLWAQTDQRLSSFVLSSTWAAMQSSSNNKNYIVEQLRYVAELAAQVQMEETPEWINKDWGTRTEESEAEELKPLISELFPRIPEDDQFLEETLNPNLQSVYTDLSSSSSSLEKLTEQSALILGIKAICAGTDLDRDGSLRLLMRQVLKQSLTIIPIRAFSANSAEHLASLYSLDLQDLCKSSGSPTNPIEDIAAISRASLIFADCPVGVCTFHTKGAKPYLRRLIEPLSSVKNAIMKMALSYTCGLIPQMSQLLTAINKVLACPLATTSGASLLFRCEKLWHELVDIWVRNHARAEESFEDEVKVLGSVIKELRQWSIDEWKFICSSRQSKVSQRFFTKTSMNLVSYIFAKYDDLERHAQLLAQFVEDLFRIPQSGLHVGEVPIFRKFLKNLAVNLYEDKNLQIVVERIYQMTQMYEQVIREWSRDKIRPLHEEILKTQKLAKLAGNQLVERDRKSFRTKHLTIARCVRDMDIHLNTTAGSVIQEWLINLSVPKRFELWRPALDLPVDSPLNAEVGGSNRTSTTPQRLVSSQYELFARISEDFEDLLTEHTQSYVMRLLKNVRMSMSTIIPQSEWRHFTRLDGQKVASNTLILSAAMSNELSCMLRACVEFFGLEESVCDVEFIRACDWYSILTNLLSHHEEFVSNHEQTLRHCAIINRILKLNSSRQVKELNSAIAVLNPELLVVATEHSEDLIRCLKTLMLVTEVEPINIDGFQIEFGNMTKRVDSLLASMEAWTRVELTTLAHSANISSSTSESSPITQCLLMEQETLVNALNGSLHDLATFKGYVEDYMILNGLDERSRKKIRRKIRSLQTSLQQIVEGLETAPSVTLAEFAEGLREVTSFLPNPIVMVIPAISDSELDHMRESETHARDELNSLCHLLVTIASVCTHLARHGMNYTKNDEENEEPQIGEDEFIQGEGLADGSGMQQAGDELKNELDFDTLADSQKDDQKRDEHQEEKNQGEETAQNVEMDFEGDLEDIPNDLVADENDPNAKDSEERFDKVDEGNVENIDPEAAQDYQSDDNDDSRREESNTDGVQRDEGQTEDALAAMEDTPAEDADHHTTKEIEGNDTDEQTAHSGSESSGEGDEAGPDADCCSDVADHDKDNENSGPDEEVRGGQEGAPEEMVDVENGDEHEKKTEIDVDDLLNEEGVSDEDLESSSADGDDVSDREEPVDDDKAREETGFGVENQEPHEQANDNSDESEDIHGERTKILESENDEEDYGGAAEIDQDQANADGADNQGTSGPGGSSQNSGGNREEADGECGTSPQVAESGESTADGSAAKTDKEANTSKSAERNVRQLTEKTSHTADETAAPGHADIELGEIDDTAHDSALAFGDVTETASPPLEENLDSMGRVQNDEKEFENTDAAQEKGDTVAESRKDAMGEQGGGSVDSQGGETEDSEEERSRSWRSIESLFEKKAAQLCESLRTVLVPTNKGRYQGYYRTGKRLDMRQVLSFIASDYRKDKIWLRRNRISKRNYEIILAIDNSASMKALNVHNEAIDAMIVVSMALKRLEVGKIGIVKFGTATADGGGSEFVLRTDDVLSIEKGQQILTDHLTFSTSMPDGFNRTVPDLLSFLCSHFESSGESSSGSRRLVMILTDGRFNQNGLQPLLDRLLSLQVCPVLLFIDPKNAIYDLKLPVLLKTADRPTTVIMKNWLDPNVLPFKAYAVLNDIETIDSTLCNIVREWLTRVES